MKNVLLSTAFLLCVLSAAAQRTYSQTKGLKKGYKGIFEVGYNVGTGTYKMDRAKVNFINGYQFNPYFSLGAGVGFRNYFDPNVQLVPIFLDARFDFLDRAASPFISLGAGYSYRLTGGFIPEDTYFSPTIGVSYKHRNLRGYIGINYEHQKLKVRQDGVRVRTLQSQSIGLTGGFSF